uniref:F-box domain-containing protein n=1 Tax=Leersia perrieri TaxID=77586 RepID=A0A0D9XTT5_9ORYZ
MGEIISGDALLWGPWKDIPADMLGLVLRLMPCAIDRARVRSVCRSWRAAAAVQRPPPPFPMLLLSPFRFLSFSPNMMFAASRGIRVQKDVSIRWVGSCDDWLVGTRPSWECEEEEADGHFFLVNAFSRKTICLPKPCAFHFFDYFRKTLPIVNTSDSVDVIIYEREYSMRFRKVVLSAQPASGSMCIVAAISDQTLALWHPVMTSWCLCRTFGLIDRSADITFYQGRIYMASTHYRNSLCIVFFELQRVDGGVMVSYVEQCVTEPLPLVDGCWVVECNIVEWSGKLVLIIRYADRDGANRNIRKIGIYALDFSTNPHSFTEINSLDGDCLFISSCSSKSFPACQYDGAKGDVVYFVSNYPRSASVGPSLDVLAYNVRDATTKSFPVKWLVGTRRIREREKGDGHCFLVNAFSQQTIHLPQPSAFCFFDYFSKTLPIVNTSHSIQIDVHAREHLMCFRKVILSAPPASGSKCIVAAISNLTLALWHPGMASWCVCRSFDINVSSDIAFYQGRIYMASTHYPNILRILFFEIERFNGRVTVSYVEKCVTEPLPLVLNCVVKECYIVEWSGKLVLITIYVNCYLANVIRKIGIYALDFSTSPHSVTEINSLNGDCLFISSCSSKSFPACQYDGAKGDFVYLVSNYRQQTTSAHASFDVVVYNVRDATMTSFPVLVPEDNSGLFMDNLLMQPWSWAYLLRPDQTRLALAECCSGYIPSSKADASKLSESPVPVLKTSTTLSHSISSLVFTPAIFFSFPFSTNAVTSVAYETVCLIFLKGNNDYIYSECSAREAQRRSWAEIPADIIGVVVARLPCVEDRARLRSVCQAWRAAARLHRPPLQGLPQHEIWARLHSPPPPLPLLVLSNFTFSGFFPDGAMTETRRIPLPVEVTVTAAAGNLRCVGSCEGWLAVVRQKKARYLRDHACFLVNPFSQEVINLPPPFVSTRPVNVYSRSLPIINDSGVVDCTIHAARYVMSFCKMILSSPPGSSSMYTVAAISLHRNEAKLALWRPGMTSWCICSGGCISKFSDVAFYQGKLYILSKFTTNLFVFEITEDDRGMMVSRVERLRIATDRRREAQRRSWADIPADIIGVVVARLPCVEDRARLRSVCQAWRAAARLHRPPPPLPLLVFPSFTFSGFCPDGAMTETRRIPLPVEVTAAAAAAGDLRCVGSCEGWLAVVRQKRARYLGDGACFLVNPFSQEVINLPPPFVSTHLVDVYNRSLPIINGSGVVDCTIHAAQYAMSFGKVILSSPPGSSSKYMVAAISVHRNGAKLALWRPGMTSWCICSGGCISKFSDVAFYQGKFYILSNLTTNLYAFEITEDDRGMMVSRVEKCVSELPQVKDSYGQRWDLVEWHGKLLLIVRYIGGSEGWHNICKVSVFVMDVSTNPFGFTEINSLDGDCIFISPCSSMSFPACQYDGIEDDLVYFIDGYLYPIKNGPSPPFAKFVYNIRDCTLAPFAADILGDNFRGPDGRLMCPTWFFPSE